VQEHTSTAKSTHRFLDLLIPPLAMFAIPAAAAAAVPVLLQLFLC
jgi:hypothetical protein